MHNFSQLTRVEGWIGENCLYSLKNRQRNRMKQKTWTINCLLAGFLNVVVLISTVKSDVNLKIYTNCDLCLMLESC